VVLALAMFIDLLGFRFGWNCLFLGFEEVKVEGRELGGL